jgi:hypothetical protein
LSGASNHYEHPSNLNVAEMFVVSREAIEESSAHSRVPVIDDTDA